MPTHLTVSCSAPLRRASARRWLRARSRESPVLVLGNTLEAAQDLIRSAASEGHLGWRASTLGRLSVELAAPVLIDQGLVPATALAVEAVCARVIVLDPEHLGPYSAVKDRPGLPRAVARTLQELRLAGLESESFPPDLRTMGAAFDDALRRAGLADRAAVLSAASSSAGRWRLPFDALLLLDVPVHDALTTVLLASLKQELEDVLAVTPRGDDRTLANLEGALAVEAEEVSPEPASGLERLQLRLFSEREDEVIEEPDESVELMSAPGESRECVEIVRRVLDAAAEGVPFDQMAVILRSPGEYRGRLLEAFRRAQIPVWCARGARRPDPAGRAFLALLGCREEGLSARGFAEYLSLGQAPLEPVPTTFRRAEDELLATTLEEGGAGDPPENDGLPSPRRWESLMVDAAVIGGLDRWQRRLTGLSNQLRTQRAALVREEPDSPQVDGLARREAEIDALSSFALPLLEALDGLPTVASWGAWTRSLSDLARLSLRAPDRVVSLLAELRPMEGVGEVTLAEVLLVLRPRLRDLVEPEGTRRAGRVFVSGIDEARGMAFEVIFAPGLTERVFPRKLTEDPILLDRERHALEAGLTVREDRVAAERAALHMTVGAARARITLSWSRLDEEKARPRLPSFYGLEVIRATRGALPGFDELMEQAGHAGSARLAWPAPDDPRNAIDDAEHDLAVLRELITGSAVERRGAARYLMEVNPHLARALRARGRRWGVTGRFTEADGLVNPREEAMEALQGHQLTARSFSATALQKFAACPYSFLLNTVMRLTPREVPVHVEEIDALSRGALIHDVQYEFMDQLRAEGALPLTGDDLTALWERMEPVRRRIVARFEDELSPAIQRVWEDAMSEIRADLRAWVRIMAENPEWVPDRFELAFGLPRRESMDRDSRADPVGLDCGINLRGAIDLVERGPGGIRVTDYKTGKNRVKQDFVVDGGQTLQPLLYALAAERLFPDDPVVASRLWFCTARGGFEERSLVLDREARSAATVVARTVGDALESGFLPAAPREGACRWCDYRSVCGPHEERRTDGKPRAQVAPLLQLREQP